MTAESSKAPGAGREETYSSLVRDIISGLFGPGAPLVEKALAERYSVSRTPVREALGRLEQDGLVERSPNGMRVRHRSVEEIYELYEVRSILETAAASAASARRTDADLSRMLQCLRQMESVDDPDPQTMDRLNRAFHMAIWKASHNRVLLDVLNRLHLNSLRYAATSLNAPGRWEKSLAEHHALVQGIINGDRASAAELTRQHLESARDIHLSREGH